MSFARNAGTALARFLALVLCIPALLTGALGATVSQVFSTAEYVSEARDPYFWDRIFRRVTPNRSPYITLLSRTAQRRVSSHRFYHFSEDVIPHVTTLNEDLDSSETVITVVDGSIFIAGNTFFSPFTGEIFYVVSVATNDVTVSTRPFAGTATAITLTTADDPNMELWRLGNVSREGSTAPTSHYRESANDYNLITEQRLAFEVTSLAMNTTGLRGPEELGRRSRMCMAQFKEEQERLAFFSKRTSNTNPGGATAGVYRLTGGLKEWIEADATRVRNANGSMSTEEFWAEVARDAFKNLDGATSTLTAFVGPELITGLSQARMALTRPERKKTFGIATIAYESDHGRINFVQNRQFTGAFAGTGFILPVKETRKATMTPIQTRRNDQAPDAMTRKDGFYQAWGLDRGLKQHMYLVTNMATSPTIAA